MSKKISTILGDVLETTPEADKKPKAKKANWKDAMKGAAPLADVLVPCAECKAEVPAPAIGPGGLCPACLALSKAKKDSDVPAVQAEPAKAEEKAAPVEKKPAIISKKPMDVLPSGLTYSLLSRVRNAFKGDARTKAEEGSSDITLVDGRGTSQTISKAYISIAADLGGADYLKTVRTSHVRKALKAKDVVVG